MLPPCQRLTLDWGCITRRTPIFLLEYDTERAGDFSPLRFVPKGKRVALGLVSSKTPEQEDHGQLLRRIEDAPSSSCRSRRNAALPAVAGGNALTEDQQWAKLELVVDTAQRVWGRQ